MIKVVVSDWRQVFPQLKPYTPRRLLLKAPPFLIGLYIEIFYKTSDDQFVYRIWLEVFPLWKDQVKDILKAPYFYYSLQEKKLEFSSDANRHTRDFPNAAIEAVDQFGMLLGETISLDNLWYFLGHKLRIDYKHYLLLWKDIIELKMGLAVYFERDDLKKEVLHLLKKEIKHWDDKHFQYVYKKTIKEWIEEFNGLYGDREKFMSIIK